MFEIRKGDQLLQIVSVRIHNSFLLWKIVLAIRFRDTGFQGTLNRIPDQVIGAAELFRTQKRARFAQPQVCEALQVFAVHGQSLSGAQTKAAQSEAAPDHGCTVTPDYARER